MHDLRASKKSFCWSLAGWMNTILELEVIQLPCKINDRHSTGHQTKLLYQAEEKYREDTEKTFPNSLFFFSWRGACGFF